MIVDMARFNLVILCSILTISSCSLFSSFLPYGGLFTFLMISVYLLSCIVSYNSVAGLGL